jgi:hypothetical protein
MTGSDNQAYRDACRRHHRLIGYYLAIVAWARNLDCIVLDRSHLEKLLGLKRFKSVRVRWLCSDLRAWFPHQEAYHLTRAPSSISTLFLSRVPISAHLPKGSMTAEQRLAGMAKDAPRTEMFSSSSSEIPEEAEIVLRLALFAAGLDTPEALRAKS